MTKKQLIYFASPYTHSSKHVVHERFEKVTRFTSHLIKKGYFVFSPIVYCHLMAGRYKMPTDWKYWHDFNEEFMSRCDKLLIFKLKGWQQSGGIKKEIEMAKKHKIPVEYIGDTIKKKIRCNKCVYLPKKQSVKKLERAT